MLFRHRPGSDNAEDAQGSCRSAIFQEQIRVAGFAIVAFGALLAIASLFADQLALGMPGSGFGWKQVLGTLFGLLIAGGGGFILYRTNPPDEDAQGGDESA